MAQVLEDFSSLLLVEMTSPTLTIPSIPHYHSGMTHHKIKAIFFDLDGTLRHSMPESADVFNEYVITLGLQIGEEARIRAMRWEHFYWASSADLREDLIAHSPDTENFWTEYTRRRLIATGASTQWAVEHAARVSAHMGEMYRPQNIVPPDVQRALPIL
jgi:phosphoglycolate phosphatase-like HAD superfamily hydrolase